jgi:hypothetical protein
MIRGAPPPSARPGWATDGVPPPPLALQLLLSCTGFSGTSIWCTGVKAVGAADLLLTDRPLLTCVALWAIAVALIIYRPW